MNFRLTVTLFLGVVLLLVALLVVALTSGDSVTDAGLVQPLSSKGLRVKDVDRVEITRTEPEEGKIAFFREESGWELVEPTTAKADGNAVDAVIRSLFSTRPVPDTPVTSNLSVHGLSEPTLSITLYSGEHSATVNVGITTIGADRAITFVSTGDKPRRVLPVRRADLAPLFRDGTADEDGPAGPMARWSADYRAQQLLAADLRDPVAGLKQIDIQADGKELLLARGSDGWEFQKPQGYGAADLAGASEATPDRFTGVRPLINAITALRANSPSDFIENPTDLAEYGLADDSPSRVTITLTPQEGKPEVLYLGNRVEIDGKPAIPRQYYAKVADDAAVVKVTTDRVDALKKTVADPRDLRNRDILAAGLKDRIDAIDIGVGSSLVKLRRVPVGVDRRWAIYGGSEPRQAAGSVVQELLAVLTRPRAALEILRENDDSAFVDAERKAVVKLWVEAVKAPPAEDGGLPPEPSIEATPIELIFGKREGDTVYVRRILDGQTTDMRVPESLLATVSRDRLSFIDLKLESFTTNEAKALTITRGNDVTQVVKATERDPAFPDGKWTFEKPEAMAGRAADTERVNSLLTLIAGLSPVRILSEEPSADDLKRWNLDPESPRLRVAVRVSQDDSKAVSYDIGNETDDKQNVYVRQTGRSAVFTLNRLVADRLIGDDLRDRNLYRHTPAQIAGLKIRGWKGLFGVVQTYEFEKQGGTWVAKTPPTPDGFRPDSLKIEALVNQIASPRSKNFLGEVRNEYGLNPAENNDSLEFTLSLTSGETVTLTLGVPLTNDPNARYATSSELKGEAVSLDSEEILRLCRRPADLQR